MGQEISLSNEKLRRNTEKQMFSSVEILAGKISLFISVAGQTHFFYPLVFIEAAQDYMW